MLAEGGGLEPRCASLLLAQPGCGSIAASSGGGRPPGALGDSPGKGGACGAGVTHTGGCTDRGMSVSCSSGVGNGKRWTGAAGHAVVLPCCHLLDSTLPSPSWLQCSSAVPLF